MDPTRASYARYWEPNLIQTFGFSLLAGAVATTATYPLEFIKTVTQFRCEGVGLRGERWKPWQLGINPFKIWRDMHARGGGISQFYAGFDSHLAGRLGYLAIRNTLYKFIYDIYKPVKPFNDLTNKEKMVIAGFSGGLAAWVTTPFATINIRTILDSQIKPEWRRNYGSVGQGLSSLAEGKFNHSWVNILRHVVLNISLTAPYDYFHEFLYLRFGDYGFVQPLSLFLAALSSSIITLPFDNFRTRLMYSHSDPSRNRLNYTGIMDIVGKSIRFEKSHFALWAGFYSYFMSTWMYAALTVGITSGITDRLKRSAGLDEWHI